MVIAFESETGDTGFHTYYETNLQKQNTENRTKHGQEPVLDPYARDKNVTTLQGKLSFFTFA